MERKDIQVVYQLEKGNILTSLEAWSKESDYLDLDPDFITYSSAALTNI